MIKHIAIEVQRNTDKVIWVKFTDDKTLLGSGLRDVLIILGLDGWQMCAVEGNHETVTYWFARVEKEGIQS